MSKDTPPTQDYQGAAQQQAASSANVTEQQTVANRPDINTPFGNQTWQMTPTYDPVTGQMVSQWTQNTNLTPASQQALDSQQAITQNKSNLAQGLLGKLDAQENTPQAQYADFAGVPGATTHTSDPNASSYDKAASDASFNSWLGYNKPLMDQAKSQLDTQLQNQGLKPGDQAYDTAMKNLATQQDQNTNQASYSAIGLGNQVGLANRSSDLSQQNQAFGQGMSSANFQDQTREAQVADDMQQKGFSLNQINAILSGQQVGMPNMPSFTASGSASPVQSLNAAQLTGQNQLDQYNAGQQQSASTLQGVGEVAGLAAMFF
jgi:hypothetical protein